MAKKNLLTLQTEVLRKLGLEYAQNTTLDTMIAGWINEGQKHLLSQSWWPWAVQTTSFNTTAGTSVYDLATNVRALSKTGSRLFKDGAWKRIWLVPRNKADEFLPNASGVSGVPTRVWQEGFNNSTGAWRVQLYPTPDATYSFEYAYYERPTALSASGDTCVGPEEADEVIRDYALWKAFEHTYGEQDQQAQMEQRNYQMGLDELELFLRPDHEGEHFAAPWDLRDFTDTAYVDLNTSDPLDMRGY